MAGDVRARELLVDRLPTNLASKAVIVDREVPVHSPELAAAGKTPARCSVTRCRAPDRGDGIRRGSPGAWFTPGAGQ